MCIQKSHWFCSIQLMLSTDPSYDNRTIASTLKMQIQTVQRLRAQLNASDDPLEMVERKAKAEYITRKTWTKEFIEEYTWMCWRVWWSHGAIRWPVADPVCVAAGLGAGPQVQSLQKECYDFVPFSHWPHSTPDLNLPDYFVENITNVTSHYTEARLITAIRRVFAELPPALVEKVWSQFRIRIEVVIEAEGGYIE